MTKIPTLSAAFDWRGSSLDWPVTTDVGPGLAGVIAAETRVMGLDPSSGQLAYRGVPIEQLAAHPDFEALAYLLITGHEADDDPDGLTVFRRQVRSSRRLPEDVIGLMRSLGPNTPPMLVLRAGVSAMGCHELTVDDDLEGHRQWRELRVVGQVAAMVADICRRRRGLPPSAAPGRASLAEETLAALGADPTDDDVHALDLLWVLYAAHGLDAPTFTSMVVASCLADPYANIVAGLSALRGSRSGGAADDVLEQLLPLKDAEAGRRWVAQTLVRGGVIAGFGHPVYRMPDPRVAILRKEVAAAARRTGRPEVFEIARAVEDAATRELAPRGVHININFYGALLFHLLGAEQAVVPCLMAVGRMAGTAALVREALDTIRLFRPLSRYVGHDPGQVNTEDAL